MQKNELHFFDKTEPSETEIINYENTFTPFNISNADYLTL